MRETWRHWVRGGRLAGWLLVLSVLFAGLPIAEGQELVVEQETLANGLRVWVSPLKDAETVEVRLVVLAGQADVLPRPRHTAHLLEHLLIQSRRDGSPIELQRQLREQSCRLNGESWDLATVFEASGPPQEVGYLARLLREIVFENTLEGKDVEGERGILTEELGGLPGWAERLWERVYGSDMRQKVYRDVFLESPLWYSPGFPPAQVRQITKGDMDDFYRLYYSPANSFLIIVAPVDGKEALRLAEITYGDIRSLERPSRLFEEPPHPSCFVRVRHRAFLFFGRRAAAWYGARLDHCCGRRLFAYKVLRDRLREMLHDELRVEEHLTYGVSTHIMSAGDYGFIRSTVSVDEGMLSEVAERLESVYVRLGREGISAEEMDRLKRGLLLSYRTTLARPSGRANWLVFFAVGPQGGGGSVVDPLAAIESLTAEEVNAIAREVLREDNMFLATSRPLLNVWQSTLALIIMVAVFVGLAVLAVRCRRRAKKAAAEASQS